MYTYMYVLGKITHRDRRNLATLVRTYIHTYVKVPQNHRAARTSPYPDICPLPSLVKLYFLLGLITLYRTLFITKPTIVEFISPIQTQENQLTQ
jgi:hypothetical protein